MEAFKTGDVGWRSSPASPHPRQLPRAGAFQRREGDAAESSQAVIPAPTRWGGKTGLCEKCAQYSHSPSPSKPGPCPAEATAVGAAAATAPQGPPWPVTQGHLGTGTEPAALIKSLLSNRALVHTLFKTFEAVTRLVLSARAEGSAPAGTLRVRSGVLHQPLILPEPSDISEQAHSR